MNIAFPFLGSTLAGAKDLSRQIIKCKYAEGESMKPEIRFISNVIRSCRRFPFPESSIISLLPVYGRPF
jgi:hypothetical protein